MNTNPKIVAVIACLALPLGARAEDLSVPNAFTAGTPIVAQQVNDNFAAVQTAVNSKQDAGVKLNANSPQGAWQDLVTCSHLCLVKVTFLVHEYMYATGYWQFQAFAGENSAARDISQSSQSYTYNNPTAPKLRWNGSTLQWTWDYPHASGGPKVVVRAEVIAHDGTITWAQPAK